MIDALHKKGVFLDNKKGHSLTGVQKTGFFKGVKP